MPELVSYNDLTTQTQIFPTFIYNSLIECTRRMF